MAEMDNNQENKVNIDIRNNLLKTPEQTFITQLQKDKIQTPHLWV